MNILEKLQKQVMPVERKQNFEVGDTVRVHYKIIEGNRERIQVYEGLVIAIDNKGMSKSFTVRRISYDVGVERIFPLHSIRIAKIEIVRKGKARRAKLYYLRERTGKSAKLREKRAKIQAVESIPGATEANTETAQSDTNKSEDSKA